MPDNLHIGMFTNTYKPVLSGVVRSISSFRDALTESGLNVFIFAQEARDYEDEEPFVYRYPSLEIPAYKYPMTIPVSRTIDKIIPTLHMNVIHCHHPAGVGEVGVRKAQELNIPAVFTHHTRYREYAQYVKLVPKNLSEKVIGSWLLDYMTRCQHIIVPSEPIKESLANSYGITERVTVMPTGIDLTPYKTADGTAVRQKHNWGPDQTVIISLGRLADVKNWPLLLDAVEVVLQKHPDARFVLVGDGPERPSLEKKVAQMSVANRIEFVGRVPYEEVPAYLKAADLFCYASVTETQGLVTLEALAAGLPVVAVDASGTSETVEDGVDGILTPEDSQALAEGMDKLLSDQDLYRRMQKAALQKAADWDINVLTQKLLDIYAQAAADKKDGRYVQAAKADDYFSLNWRKFFR
ncbi:MAG TPA: glycosyltransferase family 4 protein [Anaerolineae bacterium]|nr:glycosyltransferase family 4 protein [Anaerolineae bacterium]